MEVKMIRYLLYTGGLLSLLLAIFKIAMPHLFHWKESMSAAEPGMWAILYGENLGISLLLLYFAFMSIFYWQDLLNTGLGKTVMLSIGTLWLYRSGAEVLLFKIGVDGAWWRVFLFLTMAGVYLVPLV
jgi:hypothetical protein